MDIVLPLLGRDLQLYLRLQRPTMEQFYANLGTTWVITRAKDLPAVEAGTSSLAGVRVMDEHDVVPELPTTAWLRLLIPEGGWYRQQLVKLAAVAQVETPFALVLDADVLAVRPVSDADLLEGGRALRPTGPVESHPRWVKLAATVLNMDPLDWSASVTPSVLSREAVHLLAEYSAESIRPRRLRVRIASGVPGLRRHLTSWRGRLLGAFPWTEYQLYDTFLVGIEEFNRFHITKHGIRLYDNCVWHDDPFDLWVPGAATDVTYFFSVVQGNKGIPVEAIEEKLRAAGLLQ